MHLRSILATGAVIGAIVASPLASAAPIGKASLGDLVWEDSNRNGIQDGGEPGLAGVTVYLVDAITAAVLRTTWTDANGIYGFTSLAPGDYALDFQLLPGFTATVRAAGGDPTADSDIQSDGRTFARTLLDGEVDLSFDAGMVRCAADVSCPGEVQAPQPVAEPATAALLGLMLLNVVPSRRDRRRT